MSTIPKEFEVVATTIWTEAAELKSGFTFRNIMVENTGTSIVQVAVSDISYPDFSVPVRSTKTIEGDTILGKLYVRHLGGFNPTVRIKVW